MNYPLSSSNYVAEGASSSARLVDSFRAVYEPATVYPAFAQLTAQCGMKKEHNYAVMADIREGVIVHITFSKGSEKVQSVEGEKEVECAIAYLCNYIKGRQISELNGLSYSSVIQYNKLQAYKNLTESVTSIDGLAALKDRIGYAEFSLFAMGAIPYILISWTVLNYQIKEIISRCLDVSYDERVTIRNSKQLKNVLAELSELKAFDGQLRGLEIGVRNLENYTLDESMIRLGYQRYTYHSYMFKAIEGGYFPLS